MGFVGTYERGRVVRIPRSVIAALFFSLYGLGSLIIGLLLFPPLLVFGRFGRVRKCMRAIVKGTYIAFCAFAEVMCLFNVVADDETRKALKNIRGCVVVCNHVSLIDVVILISLLPDSTAVAKSSAARNFFYSQIVKAVFLVNDDVIGIQDDAKALLRSGTNLIVFPEGTRTPIDGKAHKLRRGAANFALHAGARIAVLGIECTPPVLAKGQAWFDVADRILKWTVTYKGGIEVHGSQSHVAAKNVTDEISAMMFRDCPEVRDGTIV